MAFHLHRLNLAGEPLREALQGKAKLATALTQARASTNLSFIAELATALNISPDELARPLIEDETREWSFYRNSAQNHTEVWQRARDLWTKHGLSLRQAAQIIGMKQPNVSSAINGSRPAIFDWHHAQRLSQAIDVASPEQFLPTLYDGATGRDG